ncbi:hypothetical protein TIFTF001_032747 [Ficus carica]|uniref:AAA+ ATPase domain-containing protein n=1 Tax=Ficus carica TaxID=3494 RepID=A0AA88DX88_FICCA|nr:hypothetical protein TIFTF001_032747 [Ficus carica]
MFSLKVVHSPNVWSYHVHIMVPEVLEGTTFERKREKIWASLINDEVTRIGVHGMGGSGKTTVLEKIIYRLLESKDKFDDVIWVTVSKESDILNLEYILSRKLDLDLSNDDDDDARESKLRTRLVAKKRFILILDDLAMSCEPIKMEPLSQNEALDWFLKMVRNEVSSVPSLKEVVDQIVEQCARLPLAIVIIAGSLRGQVDHDKWVVALEELREATKGSKFDRIMEILKFRACLVMFSIFSFHNCVFKK